MTIVPQPPLERSVLERKERDELATIATAMGVKPAARASKATLIDQILREAGIETAPEPKPRRRTTKAAASAANGDEGASQPADEPAPAPAGPEVSAKTERETPDAGAAADSPPARNGSGAVDADSGSGPAQEPSDSANSHAGADDKSRDGGQKTEQRLGSQQQPFEGDQANRRGRRRRGRDRGERDAAGEPRGGQPEPQFQGEPVAVEGLLDVRDEGFGFLRTNGYLPSQHDVYVSLSQVRRFGLRKGDTIKGASRPAGSSEKYPALLRIDSVSGMTADEARQRPRFEDLTPLFPDDTLRLEVAGDPGNMVARIVDLVSPIGKGQRGLIVSPPKAGKTTVLKQIANSIETNNPEVHLMVLLVDERPEEVTDMRRSVKGEVIASTFDRPSEEHTQVAELASERAKRLVEMGNDVVIVLDGITRLARAYNLAAPTTGRIMSGGLATDALYPPKKFFGSARNLEEGGSLTILATALIETGSKMDEVIFEEFKGTGNMELRLDRRLAERRIYPALDVNASSTRHEELLFSPSQLHQVWKLRRVLNALEPGAGLELLMDKIKHTKSNDEFLSEIAKAP
ncbi:MAG: transcription termination factor Rho [Acidimicrobiales bacterium]